MSAYTNRELERQFVALLSYIAYYLSTTNLLEVEREGLGKHLRQQRENMAKETQSFIKDLQEHLNSHPMDGSNER